jgi:pimeloyl-ACP methyl ester carboxylesterase
MPAFVTSLDGTRIAYEAHGAGSPALVLVHGWSCHRGYWDAQLTPLSATAFVVALDLAGHGESGITRQTWSIAAFGADVAAVVDELALKDIVLIGHSMGADVILEASRLLKNRVRGLVWVDQHRQLSQFMSDVQVRERVAPFRADFAGTVKAFVRGMFPASADPSLVERISEHMSSAPPKIALGALEATWNYSRNVPAILSELQLPLVSINPEDSSTGIESMRRHGVDVVLVPGVGHFFMMEKPQEFNTCLVQVVKGFTRRHGKRRVTRPS